jgi:uncharacterized tellurite resistance protein B-like protein
MGRISRGPSMSKRRELGETISQFLLSAGMMAGNSDGVFSEEERTCLAESLCNLFADPQTKIEELSTSNEANQMLEKSMSWLKDNAGEGKFVLYGQLAKVVAADGVLKDEEQAFMGGIAEGLGISQERADDIIRETLFLVQR